MSEEKAKETEQKPEAAKPEEKKPEEAKPEAKAEVKPEEKKPEPAAPAPAAPPAAPAPAAPAPAAPAPAAPAPAAPAPAAPAPAAPAPAAAAPAAPKPEEKKPEEAKPEAKKETGNYYYPNKWARVILTSAEEVMGAQGVAALLNMSGMKELIGHYPPDNMKKEFSFENVGKLQQGIWDMYGNRGARVFATRAGEQSFKDGLTQFKSVAAAAQVAMKVGTLEGKAKLGLEFFSKFFNSVSDQVVVISEDDKHWVWTITRCPVCWGRKTEEPCCHLAIGVLQAAFAWVSDGKKFRIQETECKAKGDKDCIIRIEKVPVE